MSSVLQQARPTRIVLYTWDFEHFEGCWKIDSIPPDGNELFTALNIPKKQSA